MKRLAEAQEAVSTWRDLERAAGDLRGLAEMAESEEDEALVPELTAEVDALAARFDRLEFEMSFSGPYDRRDAILAIHAGAGGTESQDWAEMLLRMYLRWAERRRYRAEVLDVAPGDEVIGVVLRTRDGVAPVYVSVGHRIGLDEAAAWALRCCRGYRIPEPLRLAHMAAGGALARNS